MGLIVCRKCEKSFSNSWKNPETGKTHNICNRKFCMECSPFGNHNTKKDISNPTPLSTQTEYTCPQCNKIKPVDCFYVRADRPNKKAHSYCKECHNKKCVLRQKDVKQQCVDYLGGKCYVCEYNKCNSALEFHHKEPDKKDFALALASYKNCSFKAMKAELDKCVLLCANCHREVHANLIQL
jgi:hypothetical protein